MKKNRALRMQYNDDVGVRRKELITKAFDKINSAKANHFYLEAITILESLIGDRLESILADSESKKVGFWTLGNLISEAKKSDNLDEEIKSIISNLLITWKNSRNTALHEMVKLEDNNMHDWDTRYNQFSGKIDEGVAIFRKLDKRIRQIRKIKSQTID